MDKHGEKYGSHILVLADDLTGSNDTGVQFTRRGYQTAVILPGSAGKTRSCVPEDVSVIDTESRFLDPQAAYQKVRSGIESHGKGSIIYKKIDSTMRGNIGAEIRAALEAGGASLALVAAAFPAAGRTTVKGKCMVDGVEVNRTDLAADPRTPVTESDIGEVIRLQYDVEVLYAGKTDSEPVFRKALARAIPQKPLVVVFDAESDDDLGRIWELTAEASKQAVYVGSAGFASFITPAAEDENLVQAPVLFVLGSVNQRSLDQAALLPENCVSLDLDITYLLSDRLEEYLSATTGKMVTALSSGSHAALRTVLDKKQYENDLLLFKERAGMDPGAGAETIAAFVTRLVSEVVQKSGVKHLYLTGGDIAIHILQKLNVSAIQIVAEVAPGIPEGRIEAFGRELKVITKAGGFGERDILQHVANCFAGSGVKK
jgi:D-threonate/D-erythronate kinase